MVVFCDKYTENVEKLRKTLRNMGQEVEIAVLQDDGFLPDEILSPYEFFVYRDRMAKQPKRDLFYNFIPLPELWEVRLVGWTGAIFDMGCEKAKIHFREPVEERKVLRVEWHMEDGWVYKIDHYNKYGLKYTSEFLDRDGRVESRVFYSEKNQEMVVEQPENHVISILENGAVRNVFGSYVEFIEYYRKETGISEVDTIFVQEEKTLKLLELTPEKSRKWTNILFTNDELCKLYQSMGGNNGIRFYAVPEWYPENHARAEALILTASDQIEKLEYLIGELPELTFHIAAHTQVSDKLHRLAELNNVKIYPQISAQDLDRLWNACDLYLDINYYREIYDAVNSAHMKNMLIIGFENTVHHKELMAEECVFAEEDGEKVVSTIKKLWKDANLLQEKLEIQQRKKEEIWKKFVQRGECGHGI